MRRRFARDLLMREDVSLFTGATYWALGKTIADAIEPLLSKAPGARHASGAVGWYIRMAAYDAIELSDNVVSPAPDVLCYQWLGPSQRPPSSPPPELRDEV
jgi:hypothetical protein